MTTFSIGTWISNKIGNNEYFLVLDYDNVDKLSVVKDIEKLQKKYNLSSAQFFRTHNWYHVYFFYDNSLSAEQVLKILNDSEFVDHNFLLNFETLSKEGLWLVIRTGGKYEGNDISQVDEIHGREANLLEKSVWDSLREIVTYQINNPLIEANKYKYEIDSIAPGNEKSTPISIVIDESQIPSSVNALNEYKEKNPTIHSRITSANNQRVSPFIDKEELQEHLKKEQAKENIEIEIEDDILENFSSELKEKQKEELEVKKITIDEIWPKNSIVTEARKKWYANPFVPRLISASAEGREVGFIKDQKIQKIADELWEKQGVQYKISNFAAKRMIFLNNTVDREQMEKVFYYNVEKTSTITSPLAFFESVAKLDMKNPIFKELRKNTPLHDNEKRKELSSYMHSNFLDLVTGYDIIFDFDTSDWNSTESYDNAKKMKELLQKMRIPFSLNFSWNKGFHIRIKSNFVNEACPEFLEYIIENTTNIRNVFNKLEAFAKQNNIKIDMWLYNWDLRGLIRVEWSIHQFTWSVVKPLKDSEFDELQGMTLKQIQEKFSVDNLLKWNFQQKLQRNEFITKMEVDWIYMSWEEMRDSWMYNDIDDNWKSVWENYRNDYINPINKELRAIAKEDPKKFAEIISKWEYQDFSVEAPEYINLNNGSNYDYMRKWDIWALREFVLDLIK